MVNKAGAAFLETGITEELYGILKTIFHSLFPALRRTQESIPRTTMTFRPKRKTNVLQLSLVPRMCSALAGLIRACR